jgi:hypothetical protein
MFICCKWNSWNIKTSLGVRFGGAFFDKILEFASPCLLSFGHQALCFLVNLGQLALS